MTPSEIAAYFDTMKNGKYGAWATQAAATICELEAEREAAWSLLLAEKAKLKIATEALDELAKSDDPYMSQYSSAVLARIEDMG